MLRVRDSCRARDWASRAGCLGLGHESRHRYRRSEDEIERYMEGCTGRSGQYEAEEGAGSALMHSRMFHPSWKEDINVEEVWLPDDPDMQTAATISLMKGLALADAPYMEREVAQAYANGPSGTQREKCERIFRHVKAKISFTDDSRLTSALQNDKPHAPFVEALIRPRDMIEMCAAGQCQRVGDCDDFSMMLASLLANQGVKCKFVTIAADQANPKRFSHVYVAAYPDGERLPLDASHGPSAGWESPRQYRITEWPVNGMDASTFAVLGLLAFIAWGHTR